MRPATLTYQRVNNSGPSRSKVGDFRVALWWGGGTLLFIGAWLWLMNWIATDRGRYGTGGADVPWSICAPLLEIGGTMALAAWLLRGKGAARRYASGVASESAEDLQSLRIDYSTGQLDEADVAADPIEQFQRWFDAARQNQVREPNAMTLATVDIAGRPSARIVLLKSFDVRGFVFFTNYDSAKGHDLANNANVALLFFWEAMERQVRIQGRATPVSAQETADYFAKRPRGARIGAWASPQSQPIASREVLMRRVAELDQQFGATDVPPPPNWGGYRVVPSVIEFWQGRPSRLHDRLQYTRVDDRWQLVRLAP